MAMKRKYGGSCKTPHHSVMTSCISIYQTSEYSFLHALIGYSSSGGYPVIFTSLVYTKTNIHLSVSQLAVDI